MWRTSPPLSLPGPRPSAVTRQEGAGTCHRHSPPSRYDFDVISAEGKHVFISYVKEDGAHVDKLCKILEAAQIPYWRDRASLAPGDNWKTEIRKAIRSGALIFLACFSENTRARTKSIMNEELTLAIDEFRQIAPGVTWLIPVRFDDVPVPDWPLGAGRSLNDLNYVNLFGEDYTPQAASLVAVIGRAMGTDGPDPATTRAAVEEAAEADRPMLLRRMTKEMLLNPSRRIELDDLIAQETKTILTAMRDEDRFPTQAINGTNTTERTAHLATIAADYWKLVEPFCWSLQVAARWAPDAAALAPWTKTLRALCAEATELKGGNTALLALRATPTMVATFVAALACTGEPRWDNLKTLVVDTSIFDKQLGRKIPLVEAAWPWLPFRDADIVPHVVARAAIHKEDHETAAAAFVEEKRGKYYTPVAEWLHHILRPMFDEQFPDDTTYTSEFDRAEAMMGIISQDQELVLAGDDPHRRSWAHSSWFGRSAWRSWRGSAPNPVTEIASEKLALGAGWAPLDAGLFGGDSERADKAITAYAEDFAKVGRQRP